MDDDDAPAPNQSPAPDRPAPTAMAGFGVGGCAPGQGMHAPVPVSRDDEALAHAPPPGLSAKAAIELHDEAVRRAVNPFTLPGYHAVHAALGRWADEYRDLCETAAPAYTRAAKTRDLIEFLPDDSLDAVQAKVDAACAADAAWLAWRRVHATARAIYLRLHRREDFAEPPGSPS